MGKSQLSDDLNASQRTYLIPRLVKVVKWAALFPELCAIKGDSRTYLETEAYTFYMRGNLLFEQDTNWDMALKSFKNASCMVFYAPFVRWVFIPTNLVKKSLGGTYEFLIGNGEAQEAGQSFKKGKGKLQYQASAAFVQDYGEILPLGNKLKWTTKTPFIAWLDGIIYHSFLIYSSPVVEKAWLMLNIETQTQANPTTIPIGFQAGFNGEGLTKWILLKHGNKIHTIEVVDNILRDGWRDLKIKYHMLRNFKLILGCERKWIFDMMILKDDQTENTYKWTSLHGPWTIPPTPETLVTSQFPSMIAALPVRLRFGHYYLTEDDIIAVFQQHFDNIFQFVEHCDMKIMVGGLLWTIPIRNHHLEINLIKEFVRALNLQPLDFLFVSVIDEAQLAIVVFNSLGVERTFRWV